MKILAVETSGYEGSVALSNGPLVLNQRSLSAEGRRHAQTLVSEVSQLLSEHALKPAQIDAVAVSIGPGSFTGLRVGVVFAKTFAWVNDACLVAVDTLQAIAHPIPEQHPLVTVISDAQRQEVFVNQFLWDSVSGVRKPTGELQIQSIAEFAAAENAAIAGMLTGPGVAKFADHFSSEWSLAEPSAQLPCAAAIAELGWWQVQDERFADIASLEPVYVRRSYAEEKAGQ